MYGNMMSSAEFAAFSGCKVAGAIHHIVVVESHDVAVAVTSARDAVGMPFRQENATPTGIFKTDAARLHCVTKPLIFA